MLTNPTLDLFLFAGAILAIVVAALVLESVPAVVAAGALGIVGLKVRLARADAARDAYMQARSAEPDKVIRVPHVGSKFNSLWTLWVVVATAMAVIRLVMPTG